VHVKLFVKNLHRRSRMMANMNFFPPLDFEYNYLKINYKDKNVNSLVSGSDEYSFLRCGKPNQEALGFFAIFSAFDSTTSLLI